MDISVSRIADSARLVVGSIKIFLSEVFDYSNGGLLRKYRLAIELVL
jgi:hypothetical protein